MGRPVAGPRRRLGHRPGQRRWRARSSPPGSPHDEFIERATTGFDAYRAKVEPYTLEYAERETGVPADAIREAAHAYAAPTAPMICWTLGITEHHNAVDNVLALISLALLTGHVGKYGSGINPLRGQNNVQGGGDMGALPDRLPGFQHVENDALRAKFDAEWGVTGAAQARLAPVGHVRRHGARRADQALYVIGENPVQSEADQKRAKHLLCGPRLHGRAGHLPDRDGRAGRRGPAGRAPRGPSREGTVTNSERRVQRVRKAMDPPGEARDDLAIIFELAAPWATTGATPTAEAVWDEVRRAVAGPRRA